LIEFYDNTNTIKISSTDKILNDCKKIVLTNYNYKNIIESEEFYNYDAIIFSNINISQSIINNITDNIKFLLFSKNTKIVENIKLNRKYNIYLLDNVYLTSKININLSGSNLIFYQFSFIGEINICNFSNCGLNKFIQNKNLSISCLNLENNFIEEMELNKSIKELNISNNRFKSVNINNFSNLDVFIARDNIDLKEIIYKDIKYTSINKIIAMNPLIKYSDFIGSKIYSDTVESKNVPCLINPKDDYLLSNNDIIANCEGNVPKNIPVLHIDRSEKLNIVKTYKNNINNSDIDITIVRNNNKICNKNDNNNSKNNIIKYNIDNSNNICSVEFYKKIDFIKNETEMSQFEKNLLLPKQKNKYNNLHIKF